jgi:hypothetical protein
LRPTLKPDTLKLMQQNNWQLKTELPEKIRKELGDYHPLVAQLLHNRGINTKEEAKKFFEGDYEKDLHSPTKLKALVL